MPRPTLFVGIDPGASGGMAVLGQDRCEALAFRDFAHAQEWLRSLIGTGALLRAGVEKLTGFVGVPVPSHTMFKLGQNSGQWLGLLQGHGIPTDEITPQAWQRPYQLTGLPKPDRKRALQDAARELYPALKPTLKTCDAVLIAHHVRQLTASSPMRRAGKEQQ